MCLREAAETTAGLGRDDIIQAQASSCSNTPQPGRPAQGDSSPRQGCVLLLVGRSPNTPCQGPQALCFPSTVHRDRYGSGLLSGCAGHSSQQGLDLGGSQPAAGSRAWVGCGVAGEERRAPQGLGVQRSCGPKGRPLLPPQGHAFPLGKQVQGQTPTQGRPACSVAEVRWSCYHKVYAFGSLPSPGATPLEPTPGTTQILKQCYTRRVRVRNAALTQMLPRSEWRQVSWPPPNNPGTNQVRAGLAVSLWMGADV